jgi:hypothetical protein
MSQVTEIREKILKCEGIGFSRPETVKMVSEQCKVSPRNVYYHLSKRAKWQRDFLNYEEAKELHRIIVSRLNHIYREASFQYLHADNSSAKCGLLHVMLDATMKLAELCTITATPETQPTQILLRWEDSKTSRDTKHIVEVVDPDVTQRDLEHYEEIIKKTVELNAEQEKSKESTVAHNGENT